MWFVALAMTLVGDLSKGSLGASKVSVSLRVLSIRNSEKNQQQTNRKKKKKKKKKEREREIYALFACFCFPGCYAKRFMFPRSGVPACARMHKKPPGV